MRPVVFLQVEFASPPCAVPLVGAHGMREKGMPAMCEQTLCMQGLVGLGQFLPSIVRKGYPR